MRTLLTLRTLVLLAVLAVSAAAPTRAQMPQPPAPQVVRQDSGPDSLSQAFDLLDARRIPHQRLLDRVPSRVPLDSLSGAPGSRSASYGEWLQVLHEMKRSTVRGGSRLRTADAAHHRALARRRQGVTPLLVQRVRYARIRPDAFERGLLRNQGGNVSEVIGRAESPYEERQAFVAAVFQDEVRGPVARFVLDGAAEVDAPGPRPRRIRVDAGDGAGWRSVELGVPFSATYAGEGRRTVRVEATYGSETLTAQTSVEVVSAQGVPQPDESLLGRHSSRAYEGRYGWYDAHIFLGTDPQSGQRHASLRRPVVIVEPFDTQAWRPWLVPYEVVCPDPRDSPVYCDGYEVREEYYEDGPNGGRTWEEFYREMKGLPQVLQSRGFDVVLLKLWNSGNYIQRNAFALESLLSDLRPRLPQGQKFVVVGPSMGGLIARYSLAHMEMAGVDHGVSQFIAFDAPLAGANVPWGMQELADFFASEEVAASNATRALLQTAARQMLIYHWKDSGHPTPSLGALRASFLGELGRIGWPDAPGLRRVALVNGSGHGLGQAGATGQRMQPGSQIFNYYYGSEWTPIHIHGNAWAVPNQNYQRVFDGFSDAWIFRWERKRLRYLSGSRPFDSAPGGRRNTMEESAGPKKYGEATTAFPAHAFIPTISGLDLPTADPYYNVHADPQGFVTTHPDGRKSTARFDALYYPLENEVHLDLNAFSPAFLFLMRELDPTFTPPPPPPAPLAVSLQGPTTVSWGEEATFFAQASGGTGTYAYRWYIDGIDVGVSTAQMSAALNPPTSVAVEVTSGASVQTARAYVSASLPSECDPQDLTCAAPLEAARADAAELVPTQWQVHAPAPNPVRGRTFVQVDLPEAAPVQAMVYDLLGREVLRVGNGTEPAGVRRLSVDASRLPAGTYVLHVQAGPVHTSHRLLVQR